MELAAEQYKQTEVGLIPSDWDIAFLDDLIDKKRSIRYGIVQPGKFDPNGRYLVRGQDYSFGWADPYTLYRVSPDIEEKYKNARLKSGDLVLTIVGASTGHVESVPNWLDGANITQTTARIPIDDSKANSEYCKQYLQSSYGWKIVLNFMKGAAQPGLNIGDIRIFKIISPPLPEQTAIATALSVMDELIAQTEKLIEKKKAIKQGVMQELLRPKDGWVVKKLGELSQNISSGKSATNSNEGQYPIYGSTGIIGWNRDYDYNGKKILVARVGANAGTLNKVSDNYCVSDNTLIISLHSIIDIDFVFLSLQNFNLNTLVYGTGQPLITGGQLKELEIHHPSNIERQIELSNIIMDMDNEIIAIEKTFEKHKMLKQGMMQSLLTGKIRLV